MKKFIKTAMAILILLFTIQYVKAQPDFDDEVQDAPIDGGVGILVVAGIAYGMKKRNKMKRESED